MITLSKNPAKAAHMQACNYIDGIRQPVQDVAVLYAVYHKRGRLLIPANKLTAAQANRAIRLG